MTLSWHSYLSRRMLICVFLGFSSSLSLSILLSLLQPWLALTLALARSLPSIASTLSVMFIIVLGVFSGVQWFGEVLHWQDWAVIASVPWPARTPAEP